MKKKDIHETLVALLNESFKTIEGTDGTSFDVPWEKGLNTLPVTLHIRFKFGEFTVEKMNKDIAKLCKKMEGCGVGSVRVESEVQPLTPYDGGDLGVLIWLYLRSSKK